MMVNVSIKPSELLRYPALLLIGIAAISDSARAQPVAEIGRETELQAEQALVRKFQALLDRENLPRRHELDVAVLTAVHFGLRADNSEAGDEDEIPGVIERQQRREPDVAAAVFNCLLYNAVVNCDEGARQRLETLLRQRISLVDRMCGLSQGQKEKLRLAGNGEIERLFDQIESQRNKFVTMIASDADGPGLDVVIRETNSLRNPLNSGSLQDNSLFANVLRNCLTPDQITKYRLRRRNLTLAMRRTVPNLESAK